MVFHPGMFFFKPVYALECCLAEVLCCVFFFHIIHDLSFYIGICRLFFFPSPAQSPLSGRTSVTFIVLLCFSFSLFYSPFCGESSGNAQYVVLYPNAIIPVSSCTSCSLFEHIRKELI